MRDLAKLIVAEGFKTCPKSNKSPNLVTLIGGKTIHTCSCVHIGSKVIEPRSSVTRLGNFWKNLVTYYSLKLPKYLFYFLGNFEIFPFEVKKLLWLHFGLLTVKFGHLLFQHLVTLPRRNGLQAYKRTRKHCPELIPWLHWCHSCFLMQRLFLSLL